LNYLDAHEPFLPPPEEGTRFGLCPESSGDYRMLLEYWDRDKLKLSKREIELARDSYDNCIASLDRRIGSLLNELERRDVLKNTLVIVTSDHGEHFGEHDTFDHGFSLYCHELHVPLLLITSKAPAGRAFNQPVSLRDLPATVVDLAGLGPTGSPFPGRSLAEHWRSAPGQSKPLTTSAISEVDIPLDVPPQRGRGPNQRGFSISLVQEALHYVLDIHGREELYNLALDPDELRNVKDDPGQASALARLRNWLGDILRDNRAPSGVAADYRKHLRNLVKAREPHLSN
jgi:arylsulfatase A-like enzyme